MSIFSKIEFYEVSQFFIQISRFFKTLHWNLTIGSLLPFSDHILFTLYVIIIYKLFWEFWKALNAKESENQYRGR